MYVPNHLNYDINGVINKCKNKYIQTDIDYLVSDINKLVESLKVCENSFHGKGKSNVIYNIYNDLSSLIGNDYYRRGLKNIIRDTVSVVNNDYQIACRDRNELDRLIEEERRRQEEEERRRRENNA